MDNLISGHTAVFWLAVTKSANRFCARKQISVTDCVAIHDALRTGARVQDVAVLHGVDFDTVKYIAVLCGLDLNYRQLQTNDDD